MEKTKEEAEENKVKALIIAAHGSRKNESNAEVASLADRLSKKATGSFESVDYAFLQFAEPLLESKIEELARKGIKKIVIFPFFIAAGSHIRTDIPEIVKKSAAAHGDIEFIVTDHLGKIQAVEEIILREVMH
nr:cobalamin biosynthesis protein CbiX [Desulfobacula sp.]